MLSKAVLGGERGALNNACAALEGFLAAGAFLEALGCLEECPTECG